MATDWKLIRRLMNSALDACESLDTLEIREQEHGVHLTGHGSPVSSVFDALQSAHVFPESVRYALIRARGHLGDAPTFVQPISRVLQQVGAVCAELVGAEQLTTPVKGIDPRCPEEERSVAEVIEDLAQWFEDHFVPLVRKAVEQHRSTSS